MLGEDLVLFRANGRVAALVDRCAHRGSRLSLGRTLFPNTITCAYHGWTYDADGRVVAAIIEGPESQVPGSVCIRSYRTEERSGVVWGFMGEGEPVPLDEDLPPPLKEPGGLPQFLFEDWHCTWRLVTENFPDMLHAPFVHRTSPEMVLQKLPAWGTMVVEPLADGKGLYVRGGGGGLQASYPGVGLFPRRMWFRVFSRRDTRGVGAEVRMPGYIVLPQRRDPLWGHYVAAVQWPVPVDEGTTRIFECAITRPRNALHRLALVAWWNLYYRHVHVQFFTHQDRRIMEQQTYRDPERLSASDVGLVRWRYLSALHAAQRESREC
jgi:phenylpropionate dioxygenase-like ring-hydroxylating dioxygenase large terminal subunit